jgi:hypothetical protein
MKKNIVRWLGYRKQASTPSKVMSSSRALGSKHDLRIVS